MTEDRDAEQPEGGVAVDDGGLTDVPGEGPADELPGGELTDDLLAENLLDDDQPQPLAAVPRVEASAAVLGLTRAAFAALEQGGLEVLELALTHLEAAAAADIVVVSTRLPRGQLQSAVRALRQHTGAPVVALAHAGGEATAVELMRIGATTVVAEGNEPAVLAALAGVEHETPLAETYETQVGRRRRRDARGGRGRDTVTDLPTAEAFDSRLRELDQAGDPTRVGFFRVLNFEQPLRRLASEAVGVLRRRLTSHYVEIAREQDVELFSIGPADLAFVAVGLDRARVDQFAKRLARFTEGFSPTVHGPLALAVGHAGPETGSDLGALRELAQRALGVAAVQDGSAVVSAEDLSGTLASTTELEVALRVLAGVERHDPTGPSHGSRVAAYASEIAQRLGFEGNERALIRFAAHLHDIGKIGLPPEAMFDGGGLDAAQLEAYRTHPLRGEEYLRLSAGSAVAASVRGHHEHWDGSGFPDGLAGLQIPVGARIIAVADAWDRVVAGAPTPPSTDEVAAALREGAETRFDPGVVEACLELLSEAEPEESGVLAS